jgi:hypothetical protein
MSSGRPDQEKIIGFKAERGRGGSFFQIQSVQAKQIERKNHASE